MVNELIHYLTERFKSEKQHSLAELPHVGTGFTRKCCSVQPIMRKSRIMLKSCFTEHGYKIERMKRH